MHVRGFTKRHPDIPAALRGTYAGLATRPIIGYLQNLGVTAVELMPVHEYPIHGIYGWSMDHRRSMCGIGWWRSLAWRCADGGWME